MHFTSILNMLITFSLFSTCRTYSTWLLECYSPLIHFLWHFMVSFYILIILCVLSPFSYFSAGLTFEQMPGIVNFILLGGISVYLSLYLFKDSISFLGISCFFLGSPLSILRRKRTVSNLWLIWTKYSGNPLLSTVFNIPLSNSAWWEHTLVLPQRETSSTCSHLPVFPTVSTAQDAAAVSRRTVFTRPNLSVLGSLSSTLQHDWFSEW